MPEQAPINGWPDPDLAAADPSAHSALWQRLRAQAPRTLAVMGMTKNTGKTVALNHLLACAAADAVRIGLTSIGRDGEALDQVFSVPKPAVQVWPGTLVATARDTLARAGVRCKLLATTGVNSPMGEVVLVRTLDQGTMEVAGASRNVDQLRIIGLLQQAGADLVLLDGALGRSHHASPALADAVLLATGAAIGGGLHDIVRKTRERLALLTLPAADPALAAQCTDAFEHAGVTVWNAQGTPIYAQPLATLNAAQVLLTLARQQGQHLAVIALTGALGRQLIDALTQIATLHPGLRVVVADGTRLFVSAAELARFAAASGRLVALRPIHLLGLTVNPYSPYGGSLDAADLLAAMRSALPEYTVCDVIAQALAARMQSPGQQASCSHDLSSHTPSPEHPTHETPR